jgi:hypothetical protein
MSNDQIVGYGADGQPFGDASVSAQEAPQRTESAQMTPSTTEGGNDAPRAFKRASESLNEADVNARLNKLENAFATLRTQMSSFMESVNSAAIASRNDTTLVTTQLQELANKVDGALHVYNNRGRGGGDDVTSEIAEIRAAVNGLVAAESSRSEREANAAVQQEERFNEVVAHLTSVLREARDEMHSASQAVSETNTSAVQSVQNSLESVVNRLDNLTQLVEERVPVSQSTRRNGE